MGYLFVNKLGIVLIDKNLILTTINKTGDNIIIGVLNLF